MARLRYNNQAGVLGAAITTAPAANTSETWPNLFAVAPDFATITGSDYIALGLDWAPSGAGVNNSKFEIVYLTAYTAGQTAGTITRGAEDATNWPPVAHAAAATWGNDPTIADFIDSDSGIFTLTSTGNTITVSNPTGPTTNVEVAGGPYATSSALTAETNRAETAEALLAPLASPALTGSPTAPTKTALTNNTDLATTAYADSAVAVETSRAEGAEATNATAISTETSRAEGVEATLAPLASPILTGTPTAPTQSPLTNNTDLATTAYTDLAVGVETTRAEAAETAAIATAESFTTSVVAVETTRAETAEASITASIPALLNVTNEDIIAAIGKVYLAVQFLGFENAAEFDTPSAVDAATTLLIGS